MNKKNPKISIVIPIHSSMKNGEFFLWRAIQSIMKQTFKDYEIVIVQEGSMPVNTNAGIKKARGDLIKILYMDDYLAHEHSLQMIVDNFREDDMWLVTGCLHQLNNLKITNPHYPIYTNDIITGNNRIGSPSVVTIRNSSPLFFDENLSFLLDCDFYKRYYDAYGPPKIVNSLDVVIGLHEGQTSHTMSEEEKLKEFIYLAAKYEK